MKRKKNKRNAASMAMSEIICNCNAVSKGTIIEAVRKEGLMTVDQVKQCTKASGSCGGCKRLVSELLSYINCHTFNEVVQLGTICSCTHLTEDEVIKEIRARNLLSVPEVKDALDWRKPEGCPACHGAINYYLGMINSAYRSIIDEYHHVYIFQNIKPDMCEPICQCLKFPSFHLASELEKQLRFLTAPYSVTVSVSACIHNSIEAAADNIGLIGIIRGWEIHVGRTGSPGHQAGDILYVAETNEEALEMVLAFVQYYRESAFFLERISQWVDRIGLIHIREVLFDTGFRGELLRRLKQDEYNKDAADILLNCQSQIKG